MQLKGPVHRLSCFRREKKSPTADIPGLDILFQLTGQSSRSKSWYQLSSGTAKISNTHGEKQWKVDSYEFIHEFLTCFMAQGSIPWTRKHIIFCAHPRVSFIHKHGIPPFFEFWSFFCDSYVTIYGLWPIFFSKPPKKSNKQNHEFWINCGEFSYSCHFPVCSASFWGAIPIHTSKLLVKSLWNPYEIPINLHQVPEKSIWNPTKSP